MCVDGFLIKHPDEDRQVGRNIGGLLYIYIYILYGKLRERAVCGEFCVLIGYPSGQDGAILPVSFPQIKFRQSSSECTKVFSR